ncbi:MAG: class I SAM-dependent RNA methyltransferase [Opitutales bacterium]
MPVPPKNFRPEPFAYHEEIEVTVDDLSNLGLGVGRTQAGWVVMIAFSLPGERVRARVFKNHANYSEADLLEVLTPSPDRVEPQCPLFGTCGGCQYQHLSADGQHRWKQQQVTGLLQRLGGLELEAEPTHPSPRQYGYRSKLTPHYDKPRRSGSDPSEAPIGFLRFGRRSLVDVPQCPIATEAINAALPQARAETRAAMNKKRKGGTVLLRDCLEGVETDPRADVSHRLLGKVFFYTAGEFFQNNPFILPELVPYALDQARGAGLDNLVDAYCGVGVFALCGADCFEQVAGVEVSAAAVHWARSNARINGVTNATFTVGQAEAIFAEITFPGERSAMLIDPPRAGCDRAFLDQLLAFAPARLVYVSCDPATQARDLKILCEGGYTVERVRPFDLFPQTRHIESVATLRRA